MARKLKKSNKTPFFLIFSLMALVVLLALISFINLNTKKKLTTNSQAIQGGNLASTNTYPFVVAIFNATKFKQDFKTGKSNLYDVTYCTGMLISPRYVLTAGHCVVGRNPNSIGIAVGFSDLKNDVINYTSRKVVFGSEIITDYFATTNDGLDRKAKDIALVKINKNIENKTISYISDLSLINANNQVLTLGYGQTESNGKLSTQLRSVLLNLVPKNIIGHLIAQGYKKGVGNGDSGGPLLIWKNGKWNLIGITKIHFISMDKDFVPIKDSVDSIFTDVSIYAKWIKDNSGVDINQGTFIGIPPPTATLSNRYKNYPQ